MTGSYFIGVVVLIFVYGIFVRPRIQKTEDKLLKQRLEDDEASMNKIDIS